MLENKLKVATRSVVRTLNDCQVHTLMATGDNILTAVSVARQCEMVRCDKQIILGDLITRAGKAEP